MITHSIPSKTALLANYQVHLTKKESKIFDIVVNSIKLNGQTTIARVAGGWVRDKMLNKESDDIDIALDNQSGVEFAQGINNYLQSIGEEVRTLCVIQANPDQSKHLETANIRVFGCDIDCVNLRAETYTETSRIPEMRFGTAIEDALRRDFTINSLFYNLITKQIEDFTGNGINDLHSGIIRTPLPPLTTFTDDPLRVLRAIRFASRYIFTLDNELAITASSSQIISALKFKVSRERVLNEFMGMLNPKGHPYVALNMLYQ